MKSPIWLLPIAFLTACGDNAAQISTTDPESGETTTIRAATSEEEGIAPPDNLPAFAPIYPNAKIESTIKTGKDNQGMVTFSVNAKAGDIIAFYKEKGEAAGLTTITEGNASGSRMLMMAPADNPNDMAMQLTVFPRDDDGVVQQASLIYAGKATQ